MISVARKELCCGCSACAQICPKKCISMDADVEGFDYPKVDIAQCIDCAMCERICPVKNATKKNDQAIAAYAAYVKDEDLRINSSSGGIFSVLADFVLQKNGVVFGAAFDEEFMVHHIGIENKSDIEHLRGSKYLQSRIENTYIETKDALDSGKIVLYTGTACQIAGLKAFLKKEYDNLYTVDVLCHGTPSPKLWRKYIKWQEKKHGATVQKAFFRQKNLGWKTFSLELQFADSKVYSQILTKDPFMKLFLSNICLRPSCHDCKFKALERASDITIGDAWGIKKVIPEMDDDKGTSVVITHTEKGEGLFKNVLGKLVYKKDVVDILLPKKVDSRKSVKPHLKRKKFFKMLNSHCSIDELYNLTRPSLLTRVKYKILALKEKM